MSSNAYFVLLAAALVAGCASEPAPKVETAKSAADKKHKGDTSILVDNEIARKCRLPNAHFGFDSASLRPGEAPVLDALAACFMTGPLKGRAMMVVGHADPRGEIHYNFALGQMRAGSVANYLGVQGLPEDRVTTSSLGEMEAQGTDEDSWAHDRKVEVLLAEE